MGGGSKGKCTLKGRASFWFYEHQAYLSSSCPPAVLSSVRGLIKLLLTRRRHSGTQITTELLNRIYLLTVAIL